MKHSPAKCIRWNFTTWRIEINDGLMSYRDFLVFWYDDMHVSKRIYKYITFLMSFSVNSKYPKYKWPSGIFVELLIFAWKMINSSFCSFGNMKFASNYIHYKNRIIPLPNFLFNFQVLLLNLKENHFSSTNSKKSFSCKQFFYLIPFPWNHRRKSCNVQFSYKIQKFCHSEKLW